MYNMIIVDDEPAILDGLCYFVHWEDIGFTIKGAFTNGEDAINYLAHNKCHVVLSDVKMDIVSGLDLSHYIKTNLPGTYIVLISAYDDFAYAQRAIEERVFRYLLKPTKREQICEVFSELKNLLDEANPTSDTQACSPLVQSVCTYIQEHLSEDLSLNEIARVLHYNSSYLSHVFKTEYGTGINEYTNRTRINAAKEFLSGSHNMSLAEIAERVGFRSVRYFTSQFIATTGLTPTAFRKKTDHENNRTGVPQDHAENI